MNSVLDSSNPHRLMSLASRIKSIYRALTAEELAEFSRSHGSRFSDGRNGAAFRRSAWVPVSDSIQLQSPSGLCSRACSRCPLRLRVHK